MARVPGSGRPRGVALPHLRAWRRWRGMTRRHLARAVGVSEDHLYRVEAGYRVSARASADLVGRLARALRVSPARLRDESPYRADLGA